MLVRVSHIVITLLFALFCLPCYCINDNCWLKRNLGLKNNGVSKEVLKYLDKQKWSYNDDRDFEQFSMLQKLKL